MNNETKKPVLDLIPDFDEAPSEPSPLAILRQQAELIERKSQGRLRALVEAARSGSERLAYTLVLEVPVVAYRYRVLRIEFGIEHWPVHVSTPAASALQQASDVDQYTEILRSIFGGAGFRSAVMNMRRLHDEEVSLSDVEQEVLGVFRAFNIGADEYLPAQSLALSIEKFDPLTRQAANPALDALIRRGILAETSNGLGFTLTSKGAALLYSK